MEQAEALRAQLADLAASVEAIKDAGPAFTPPIATTIAPVWYCTQLPDGHSLSGDWEIDNFDSRSYARYYYEKPFTTGYLALWAPDTADTGSADCPQRAKCAIEVDNDVVVDGFLIGEAFEHVRIKVNGLETDYTSSQAITFHLRRGRNEIVVMTNSAVDGIELRVRFFTKDTGRWLPS